MNIPKRVLVVDDIFMPEMDGIEAIDRVHAAYPGTRIVAKLVALVRRLADQP